jgi:hypothetical protein
MNVNKRNLGQNSSENISISAPTNSNSPPKNRSAILWPTKSCRFFQENAKETRSAVMSAGRQFQIDISVMPSNLTCTLTPIQSGDESAAPNIRRVNKFQRLIAWPITTTHHPPLPSFNILKITCPPNTILSFNHSSQSTF